MYKSVLQNVLKDTIKHKHSVVQFIIHTGPGNGHLEHCGALLTNNIFQDGFSGQFVCFFSIFLNCFVLLCCCYI